MKKVQEELPATNTTSVAGAGDDGIVVVKKKNIRSLFTLAMKNWSL